MNDQPTVHDADKERRRQRRDYIRAHHPDRGGDPGQFVIGLAALDRSDVPPADVHRLPRVHVVPTVAWPVSLITALRRRVRRSKRPRRVH